MSDPNEVILNQLEAHEYAIQRPQKEISEALLYAIGEALFTLAADPEYVENLPERRFDMLLYVKLLDELFGRKERLLKILAGDFTSDWLPPELEALLHDKKSK